MYAFESACTRIDGGAGHKILGIHVLCQRHICDTFPHLLPTSK